MLNSNAHLAGGFDAAIDTDFSLERAEIAMLLTMRQHDGDAFDAALDFALAASGNERLFTLPSAAFSRAAETVVAIRIRTDHATGFAYAYHCAQTDDFLIADAEEVDELLVSLAAGYAEIAGAMMGPTTH